MSGEEKGTACRVCGNTSGNRSFTAREMMFGFRDEFEYVECGACGCLQLVAVPETLSDYYPPNYYAHQPLDPPRQHFLKAWLKRRFAAHELGSGNLWGWLLARFYGEVGFLSWLKRSGISTGDAILDVGCGFGELLLQMHGFGLTNLTGADPFLPADMELPGGVRLLKRFTSEIRGQYDLVMLNHSFEHMPNPAAVFDDLYRLACPGGVVVIRIPLADSYAWRVYGPNWVQLDAPRHLFVHTRRSVCLLAERSGFAVADILFDSTAFQFWASEQYKLDLPLYHPKSRVHNPAASPITADQMRLFEQKAAELNAAGDGDQAVFFFRKPMSILKSAASERL